ncbi:MAG: putative transposase [Loktanella salsilacus]|jgi:putative transposase|tara:strand:- start:128 stop:247 length:120 start_codon:yes stop_codon:yes gene_type:complete
MVSGLDGTIIDFKGVHYPRAAILSVVFFYLRYAVRYRDL